MGWKLKAPSGGTVELTPVDTASDVTLNMPAMNGVLVTADASTGAALFSVGYTFQRPSAPAIGMCRVNKDTGAFECYNGSAWR